MSARFRGVGVIVIAVAAAATAWACGDDDAPAPGDVDAGDGGDTSPTDAAPADTGTNDTGSPDAEAPAFVCADAGASVVDASACAVSFKTDVFPLLSGCANCHSGGTPPKFSPNDPDTTWKAFAAFESKVKRRLIDPCSTAVADSVLVQTLDPTVPADERGSLMPPGAGLASAVPKVKQWVECGAPNN
ncbi:MAG: hypothetical protein KIT84_17905 [Labilithrix sp.]|nr:hypothetical protein [Labilithrix sp.]MCW5812907.1 hypothetical protein [Labilithrix sp.]